MQSSTSVLFLSSFILRMYRIIAVMLYYDMICYHSAINVCYASILVCFTDKLYV